MLALVVVDAALMFDRFDGLDELFVVELASLVTAPASDELLVFERVPVLD